MVLRRIFVPKRDEVTGDWREQHNEELHNLYFSPNMSEIGWISEYPLWSRTILWREKLTRFIDR
jgi:hypothetical protein